MMKKLLLLLVGVGVLSAFVVVSTSWNIDPNYTLKFSGKGISKGTFSGLKGTVVYDENNLNASQIDITIDANTIKTGDTKKDEHARNSDWFDTEKYPTIRFATFKMSKEKDRIQARATIEIHGIKREIEVPLFVTKNGEKRFFYSKFKLNRRDFGIKGNAFGFVVANEYEVEVNVPISKK